MQLSLCADTIKIPITQILIIFELHEKNQRIRIFILIICNNFMNYPIIENLYNL